MYDINFSKQAKKYIQKQDKSTRNRIKNNLLRFAEDPFNKSINNIRLLKGYDNVYRLRIGNIRVLYNISNKHKEIFIQYIDNRGDVYKHI